MSSTITLEPDARLYKGETPVVSIDCEMVMCSSKYIETHELARISIVNYNGHVLMD